MPIIAFTQTWAFPWRSGMAGMLTARARRVSIAGTFQVLLVQFAFEVWTFVGTVGFRIHVHFYNFKMGVLLCDVMGLLRAQLSRKICTMHNSFTFFNRIATSYEYLMHIAKRIWASSRNCICNLTNPLHWVFFFITKYSYSNMKLSHRVFYWVKSQFFRTLFGLISALPAVSNIQIA